LLPRGKVYIPLQRITHNDHVLVIKDMPLDSDKKIGKLKDIAIGRCRERIEQAACKAKELMNKPLPEGQKKSDIYYNNKSSGITSILKKRHGL
jgi:hypothetical protein